MYGLGIPIGYILIQSNGGAEGVKQRYLEQFLDHFKTKWNIRALITLSDKDWSEINAFLKTFPEAKHQLCFWHALRAIKSRLSILRQTPTFYDAAAAHAEFHWIDKTFVPIGQSTQPKARLFSNLM